MAKEPDKKQFELSKNQRWNMLKNASDVLFTTFGVNVGNPKAEYSPDQSYAGVKPSTAFILIELPDGSRHLRAVAAGRFNGRTYEHTRTTPFVQVPYSIYVVDDPNINTPTNMLMMQDNPTTYLRKYVVSAKIPGQPEAQSMIEDGNSRIESIPYDSFMAMTRNLAVQTMEAEYASVTKVTVDDFDQFMAGVPRTIDGMRAFIKSFYISDFEVLVDADSIRAGLADRFNDSERRRLICTYVFTHLGRHRVIEDTEEEEDAVMHVFVDIANKWDTSTKTFKD